MGRKNSQVGRRKVRREFRSNAKTNRTVRLPPIPIEAAVVPKGRCFIRSRNGKLKFTKDQVNTALRHAQHNRAMKGSTKVEARYYSCEDGRPEGCGFWHLTSMTEKPGARH
jgi:hypothetical protein